MKKANYCNNKCFLIKDFKLLLQRERARSDRSGAEFSLVVYPLEQVNGKNQTLPVLLRALDRRVRSVDAVGWFQENAVGVLLPSTGLKGAQLFAADFTKSLPRRLLSAPFLVFSYPEHWYQNGIWSQIENGTGGGSSSQELPRPFRRNGQRGGGPAKPTSTGDAFTRVEDSIGAVFARRTPGWKRGLDVTGALLGIALCSPLFLILSAYIKIVSPGPVLFRQARVGYQGKLFTFFKLRTMYVNNDTKSHRKHLKELIHSDVPMTKLDAVRDPRIMPGAGILRRTCVDELPQLFNVLRGEMSLVGPRPCLPYEAEEYRRWHAHRFDVLPGITGLWQVSGKNNLTFQQMIRLDIAYSTSMSLLKDLKILLLTGPAIAGFLLEVVRRRVAGWHTPGTEEDKADSMSLG